MILPVVNISNVLPFKAEVLMVVYVLGLYEARTYFRAPVLLPDEVNPEFRVVVFRFIVR